MLGALWRFLRPCALLGALAVRTAGHVICGLTACAWGARRVELRVLAALQRAQRCSTRRSRGPESRTSAQRSAPEGLRVAQVPRQEKMGPRAFAGPHS